MSLLSWLFGDASEPPDGEMAVDMQEALATIVKRALKDNADRKTALVITVRGTSLRGIPLGDWRITAEPLTKDAP
jgi:hypothetical protein